jgi:uncharacterized protein (DUF58 family)
MAAGTFPGWSPGFQAALGRLAIGARRPAGSPYPGAVRSNALGRAIEFADYRPYVAGDEPRLIDWRVYGRLDRLYVKRHHEERERTLTLLLDASASLDFGDGEAHKGMFARRLAAALAWISLTHHEPVRAWVLRGDEAQAIAPTLALGDAPRLFRAFESLRESGPTHLGTSVRAALTGRRRGPVMLLSDLLDPTWRDALAALGAREATVLQVLAPEEWEPTLGDEVELEDAESGERIPVRLGPAEVAEYRERLEALLAEIGAEARRHGVLHVPLRSDTPLSEVVLRQLPAAGVVSA